MKNQTQIQNDINIKEVIRIRPMEVSEYPLLEDFLYEAVYVPEGEALPEREIVHQPSLVVYIENFGREHDYCLAAECEGQIIGAAWTRILSGKVKGYGNLDQNTPEFAISVKKEYRQKGIGSRLMAAMIELLDKRGYERVSLSVHKGNYAYRMYEKLGFQIVQEQEDDYLMELILKNAGAKELLLNLEKFHTTKLGMERIRRNLCLDVEDVTAWCREKALESGSTITRKGKNWYIRSSGCEITVNASSYTIITAHKISENKGGSCI